MFSSDGAIDLIINPSMGMYTYIWSNDETTEGITNLTSGDYTAIIFDDMGCSLVETYTVDFFTEDNQLVTEDFNITVYPNPTEGKFIMRYNFENNDEVSIKLTNVLGEEILNSSFAPQ